HISFLCSPARPTSSIYTLSLHDALPISRTMRLRVPLVTIAPEIARSASICNASRAPSINAGDSHAKCSSHLRSASGHDSSGKPRSEEHTSELQSRGHLVCRLLLEKKKQP